MIFTSYGLAGNVCNVVLIDAAGYILFVHSGPVTNEAAALLFGRIDSIVK